MNKKNLIIFYPSFEKGGVTKILINLLKSKKEDNLNIHIISTKNFLKDYKINFSNFFFYKVKLNKVINILPNRFSTALAAMVNLFSILNSIKGDVVIHSMQSNIAAIIVSLVFRKKVVIRNSENPIYSTLYSENKILSFFVFISKFIFYNLCDGIVTNSKGSAKSLRYFLINKNKIKHIYNPYIKRINRVSYKKKNYVLNIGRLRKQKDHKTLLIAFKIFLKKFPDFKLIILGHGNLKNKLKIQAINLKIEKKVIFKGWVNNTENYVKFSKIFVLSSVYEGLGNVLIDAINFDVPCVATNCPSGPSEILLNGRGGFLSRPGHYNELAYNMIKCQSNYNSAIKMCNYSKKKLDRFLIKKNCSKYYDYLFKFL